VLRLLLRGIRKRDQKANISIHTLCTIMSVWQEPPYVMKKKDKPVTNADFKGYIPDLLEKLASQPGCDCSFTLKLVEDGKYGVQGRNGQWNGMIGEVVHGVILNVSVFVQL